MPPLVTWALIVLLLWLSLLLWLARSSCHEHRPENNPGIIRSEPDGFTHCV